MKEELAIDDFLPDNMIHCPNDLPFEDGVYVIDHSTTVMKDHRIQTIDRNGLMMWHLEYLTGENGEQIENSYRQFPGQEKEMWSSTHFHLYPQEQQSRREHDEQHRVSWANMTKDILNSTMQLEGRVADATVTDNKHTVVTLTNGDHITCG